MTAVQAQALVLVLAGGAVVTVTAAIGQAALAKLYFRHRIEVVRDEAVTAVLDGIVPLTGHVTGWIAALEAMARARWRDIELASVALASLLVRTFDHGNPGQAQRYWLAGLQAAHAAGDRACGANILRLMSMQVGTAGQSQEAITLAEAAQQGAGQNGAPRGHRHLRLRRCPGVRPCPRPRLQPRRDR